MVIDGMLKDYNAKTGSLSEFSRKGAKKGSKDISLLYAFNPLTREPIAAKPYAGNMLDQTAIDDFVAEYEIKNGLMVFDKGFYIRTARFSTRSKECQTASTSTLSATRKLPPNRRLDMCRMPTRKTTSRQKTMPRGKDCSA